MKKFLIITLATAMTVTSVAPLPVMAAGKTGVYKVRGTYRYYKKGKIQKTYTGLVNSRKTTYFFKKGKIYNKTGVYSYKGKTFRLSKGKVYKSTGLYTYKGKGYNLKKGYLSKKTVMKSYRGKKYYAYKGVVSYKSNGFKKVGSKSYYVKKSVLQNKTGIATIGGTRYYFRKGVINYKDTGFFTVGTKVYNIKNSVLQTGTGRVSYANDFYYMKDGVIDLTFSGTADGYTIKNGKIVAADSGNNSGNDSGTTSSDSGTTNSGTNPGTNSGNNSGTDSGDSGNSGTSSSGTESGEVKLKQITVYHGSELMTPDQVVNMDWGSTLQIAVSPESTKQIAVVPVPSNAKCDVTWSVIEGDSVTIENGLIKAKSQGISKIKVVAAQNGKIRSTFKFGVLVGPEPKHDPTPVTPVEKPVELTGATVTAHCKDAFDGEKTLNLDQTSHTEHIDLNLGDSVTFGEITPIPADAKYEIKCEYDEKVLIKTGNTFTAIASGNGWISYKLIQEDGDYQQIYLYVRGLEPYDQDAYDAEHWPYGAPDRKTGFYADKYAPYNSKTFFEWVAKNYPEYKDSANMALNILQKSCFAESVELDNTLDASSFANMHYIIPMYDAYMKIRKENGKTAEPGISLECLAAAQVQNAEESIVEPADHKLATSFNENLSSPDYYIQFELDTIYDCFMADDHRKAILLNSLATGFAVNAFNNWKSTPGERYGKLNQTFKFDEGYMEAYYDKTHYTNYDYEKHDFVDENGNPSSWIHTAPGGLEGEDGNGYHYFTTVPIPLKSTNDKTGFEEIWNAYCKYVETQVK